MPNDTRRAAFARDVARQAQILELDPLRVLDRIASHLVRRHLEDGPLTLEAMRGWTRDPREIDDTTVALDEAIAAVADLIALEDQDRAELHEAARVEMLGPGDSDAPAGTFGAIPRTIPPEMLATMVQRERRTAGEDDELGGEG